MDCHMALEFHKATPERIATRARKGFPSGARAIILVAQDPENERKALLHVKETRPWAYRTPIFTVDIAQFYHYSAF